MNQQTAEKTGDLVVLESKVNPVVQTRYATDAAGACKEIVVRTAQNIGGRKYVRVEGWQAIANAFGCVASARDVERVEGGYRAIGEVRRMADGQVIATAEGFVGDDEPLWAKRPEYARRAMAQTRAISRACRSAFAFVVVAMDAGLETTPAEEMVGVEIVEEPHPERPTPPAKRKETSAADALAKIEAKAVELGIDGYTLAAYAAEAYGGKRIDQLGVPQLRQLWKALDSGAVAAWAESDPNAEVPEDL